MSATLLIARRELGGYLRSMTGYVIAAAGAARRRPAVQRLRARRRRDVLGRGAVATSSTSRAGTTIIASVFISMRLLAEERQTGTLVLLTRRRCTTGRSSSASSSRRSAFLAIITLATVYMPALIMVNGKVSVGPHRRRATWACCCSAARRWRSARSGRRWRAPRCWPRSSRACMVVAILIAGLLARVHRAAAQGHVHGAGAVRAALPAVPGRARSPARRRLLPRWSPTWRCSPRPGCWRRGGGSNAQSEGCRRRRALVGRLGGRHARHLPGRADDRRRHDADASRPAGGLLLVIGAMVMRFVARAARRRARSAEGRADAAARSTAWGWLAVVLYVVQSDLCGVARSTRRSNATGRSWRRSLAALWPVVWVGGRLADPARRAVVRARWRARRSWSWAGSAARCCRASGWPRAGRPRSRSPTSRPSATRRSTSPTSAPRVPAR